jgi:hypothetical protein
VGNDFEKENPAFRNGGMPEFRTKELQALLGYRRDELPQIREIPFFPPPTIHNSNIPRLRSPRAPVRTQNQNKHVINEKYSASAFASAPDLY